MGKQSYLLRRGGSYSARIRVPADLVELVGRKQLVKALGTRDPNEARRLVLKVVAEWQDQFERLRKQVKISSEQSDLAAAGHYRSILAADDARRARVPSRQDVDAAIEAAKQRVLAEGLDVRDPLQMLDAGLSARILTDQRDTSLSADGIARAAKLRDLRKSLSTGDGHLVSHEVDGILSDTGTVAPANSAERRELERKLIRAEIEALQRSLERDQGNFGGHPTDTLIADAMERASQIEGSKTVAAILKLFIDENPGGVKIDRLAQIRRDVELFIDSAGNNLLIADLDKAKVRDWKALLLKWPLKARESRLFSALSMREAIELNEREGKPTISPPTINRHLSSLSTFCNWCVANGYLETNPVQGMQLRKVTYRTRPTFTVSQMNKLYRSPLFTGCAADAPWRAMAEKGPVLIRDHRYWLPLIMPFSGARTGEIAQLATADVRKEHGTWIMHITTEGEGEKSLKTAGSMRVVPVHSKLIDLGFIDYHQQRVKAGDVKLFPDAVRNARGQMLKEYSREFSRYLTRIGLGEDHGLSLYSFRHGAADALRRAGFLDEQFGYILGHSSASMTGRYGHLPEGMLKQRVELIEAIEYPSLRLKHLQK